MMFPGIVRSIHVRIVTLAALAITLSLLAGCGGGGGGGGGGGVGGSGGSGTGSLTGRVVDTTPIPVNLATVTCAGKTTTTSALGTFRLDNVPSGTRTVTVTPPLASNLIGRSAQFIIQENLTTNVGDIVLQDSGPPPPPL